MNQDETIALFERCEAARAEAKKSALAEGKSEREARDIAHEAAKAIWNGEWAEPLLAEREAMEAEGRWEKENARWLEDAKADFTHIHFLVRGAEGTEVDVSEVNQESAPKEPPVKTLYVEDSIVDFSGFKFPGTAFFDSARFSGTALFTSARFSGDARFTKTSFQQQATFQLAKFDQYAGFEKAQFLGAADFNAVRGDRAFTLADAHFEHVPDFIQAHFEEAPRLDNVTVVGRMIPAYPAHEKEQDGDGKAIEPTRWRTARHEVQHCYPARLMRGAWRRVRRGLLFNDDLRDIPARWRALKRLAIQAHDQDREHEFFAREIRSDRFLHDWPIPAPPWKLDGRSCHEPPVVPASPRPKIESGQVGVIALSDHVRRKTTASYEAFQLAPRDGFLILYGDADTAHRTYGCLYGVELYGGGTPVAIVPPQVAFWSAIHKLWSAVMIFLFGLALRNMLKMK